MASLTKNPSIGSQHGTDLEESSRLIYELGFGFLDEDLIGRQSINSNSQGPKAIPVIITDAEAADDEASPGEVGKEGEGNGVDGQSVCEVIDETASSAEHKDSRLHNTTTPNHTNNKQSRPHSTGVTNTMDMSPDQGESRDVLLPMNFSLSQRTLTRQNRIDSIGGAGGGGGLTSNDASSGSDRPGSRAKTEGHSGGVLGRMASNRKALYHSHSVFSRTPADRPDYRKPLRGGSLRIISTERDFDRPSSGINIHDLFWDTKRATRPIITTEGDRTTELDDEGNKAEDGSSTAVATADATSRDQLTPSIDLDADDQENIYAWTEDELAMPTTPTYKSIFSRDLRKKVTVFGETPPSVEEVKFSYDDDLRYVRPNSREFKDKVAQIRIELQLKHGETTWSVKKSFVDLVTLNRSFIAARARTKMRQIAQRETSEMDMPHLPDVSKLFYRAQDNVPKFGDVSHELTTFRVQLLAYLNSLIKHHANETALFRFLQCSFFSFIPDLGQKQIETSVRRRRTKHVKAFMSWKFTLAGWLLQKDSCILHVVGSRVVDVLLIDQAFRVEKINKNQLQLTSYNKTSVYQLSEKAIGPWNESLKRLKASCEYAKPGPNESFAPERPNSRCMFFIDGFKYFQSLYHALMSAREEIFITDWWLTPSYYLIRKYDQGDEHKLDPRYRLDHVLETKARQGVRVYILLYKEIKWAIGLQSKDAKRVLSSLHPNIKVMRHPYIGTLLWAHHEKIVVVDQLIAYVGGIDICFGRWDDMMHRLSDTGGSDAMPIDHNVPRSIRKRASHIFQRLPRSTFSQMRRQLNRARSMSQMSMPRFRANRRKQRPKSRPPLVPEESEDLQETNPLLPGTSRPSPIQQQQHIRFSEDLQRQSSNISQQSSIDDIDYPEQDTDEQPDQYLWIGQDYVNIIRKDHTDVSRPFENVIDRNTTPRMPWHDVSSVVYGACARDVARHFIQRWNFIRAVYKSRRFGLYNVQNHSYPLLIPKSTRSIHPQAFKKLYTEKDTFLATCQVVRSLGPWSGGFETKVERSIYEAYMNAIDKAEHYIYIENQFFVSSTSYNGIVLFNQIAAKIEEKIVQAHSKNKTFRVYIVLPLVPGFPGQIGQTGGAVPQKIQNWMYLTLCRGRDNLFSRLFQRGIPVTDYISVCGLRTHSFLNERLVSEIIFAHDKMMIVDDRVAIIGSANINDRSLMGDRDSEMALVFRDEEFIESEMDGKPYAAGKFCWGLRQKLFREHLMTIDETVKYNDPVSSDFFKKVWTATAAKNTKVYDEVFNAVPSDNILSFEELRDHLRKPKLAEDPAQKTTCTLRLTREVQGYLVLFPTQYLRNQDIGRERIFKESVAPETLWC
ncbi:phospholipase D1-like isoform X2 [Convolutriloba macropyga]|uniref:phospholipase D1-like isoform X2 n=1 Tax=Convolutriloba macropyga TaxID=536237 RepID=UPI003F52530F